LTRLWTTLNNLAGDWYVCTIPILKGDNINSYKIKIEEMQVRTISLTARAKTLAEVRSMVKKPVFLLPNSDSRKIAKEQRYINQCNDLYDQIHTDQTEFETHYHLVSSKKITETKAKKAKPDLLALPEVGELTEIFNDETGKWEIV